MMVLDVYNSIFIVGENEEVIETCVFRNQSDEDTMVFSDWILSKLHIEVFDIVQGTKSFKLNFSERSEFFQIKVKILNL